MCYFRTLEPELQDGPGSPGDPRGADGGSTMVASESLTKTTLEDLFDTLKKLEEEEQLATARPDKKNSWRMYCTLLNEPRHEKTCLRGFQPNKTQTNLRN